MRVLEGNSCEEEWMTGREEKKGKGKENENEKRRERKSSLSPLIVGVFLLRVKRPRQRHFYRSKGGKGIIKRETVREKKKNKGSV